MKLYFSKGVCSLFPRIIANEINAPVEFIDVDYKSKKTSDNVDFLTKVNARGLVPVLQLDNGEYLTEGVAISQYLAQNYGGQHLMPKDGTMERIRMVEWLNFITSEIHKGVGGLSKTNNNEALKARFLQNLETLAGRLKGKTYAMGNEFMLPDAYLATTLYWLNTSWFTAAKRKDYPILESYFQNLKKRPSVAKAFKDENLGDIETL